MLISRSLVFNARAQVVEKLVERAVLGARESLAPLLQAIG
jgi:hypothetical protein